MSVLGNDSSVVSKSGEMADLSASETVANPSLEYQHKSPIYQKPQPITDFNIEQLKRELLKQFEYYFSSKNLLTDNYLLSQMDHEAYVPVSLIGQFRKIRQLTNDYELILDTIRQSSQLQLDPITQSKVRSIGGHQGGLITITSTKPIIPKVCNNTLSWPNFRIIVWRKVVQRLMFC